MPQITARVPTSLVQDIDRAAASLQRSRAEIVRRAIEYYLDDLEDLEAGLAALRDPSDPVLEWSSVREQFLGED